MIAAVAKTSIVRVMPEILLVLFLRDRLAIVPKVLC